MSVLFKRIFHYLFLKFKKPGFFSLQSLSKELKPGIFVTNNLLNIL